MLNTRLARSLGNLNVVASDPDWPAHGGERAGCRAVDNSAVQTSNLNAINAHRQLQLRPLEAGPGCPSPGLLSGQGLSLSHSVSSASGPAPLPSPGSAHLGLGFCC